MANKQCSINVLGDELLARLQRAGILDDIESKIDDALRNNTEVGNNTALRETITKNIIEAEVKKIKKTFKERIVEAKNVTVQAEKLEDKVDWFVSNFPNAPAVKKFKKGEKGDLINKILIGTLYESNYSKGATLEKNTQSTFGRYWGNEIDRRLTEEVGEDWYKLTRKRESVEKIMEDLIEIQKNPSRKTSVNNSNTAEYKIARAFAESFEKLMAENGSIGGKMNFFNLVPKVRLNVNKIKDRDTFINDYAEFLSDDDIIQKFEITDPVKIKAQKKIVAEQEYERITMANPDVDTFGNTTANRDFTIPSSAKAYFDITAKYSSEQDITSVFFAQFQKLSEQHAMTKMFGNNPLSFVTKLKQQLRNSKTISSAADSEGIDILERGLKMKIERRPVARSFFTRFFTGMRNVTLGKLGFVFVDQLIMEPVFSAFRLFTRGDNTMKNILGNITPLQGKKKRLSARFHNVAMESFVGAVNNRFFGQAYESGGKITDATRRFANLFMKVTGSTYFTDGQAAAGFAVQRLDITDALKAGRKWKNLKNDPKKKRFILDLEQVGINETMWDNAVRGVLNGKFLDSDGMFDPFALPVITNTLRSRGQTDYDAWMSYFQKRVDSLSRMKPGDIENARLTFYSDQDAIRSVLKTFVQFKSFAFSIGRRVYGDAYLHGGNIGVMKQAAGLAIPMFTAGIIATQVREMAKGNAPLSFDSSDLYERAYTRSGITAILAPLLDPFVEAQVSAMYNDSVNKRGLQNDYERELLGPALSSLLGVVTGFSGMTQSLVTEKEDFKKNLFGFTRDLSSLMLPNGVPFSLLNKYLLYDVMEQNLLPKEYKKRKRREKKQNKETRSKGAKNFLEWTDRIN